MKYFVAFLAQQGILSDDSETGLSIAEDVEDLLNEENYSDAFSFAVPGEYSFMITPAILNRCPT